MLRVLTPTDPDDYPAPSLDSGVLWGIPSLQARLRRPHFQRCTGSTRRTYEGDTGGERRSEEEGRGSGLGLTGLVVASEASGAMRD